MQQTLKHNNEPQHFSSLLFNNNERHFLNRALDNQNIDSLFNEINTDENTMTMRIVYGTYQSTVQHLNRDVITENMSNATNKWLISLQGDRCLSFRIKALKMISDESSSIPSTPFAALIICPPSIKFGTNHNQAISAFLYFEHRNITNNLLKRQGIFSFMAEQKRFAKRPSRKKITTTSNVHLPLENPAFLTLQNWKRFINRKRIIKPTLHSSLL